VRQRQQFSRFAVLRPERDHLAVAHRGFFAARQAAQQNAEVGPGVDVFAIQPDRCAILSFRLKRLSARPQQHCQIVMGVGVAGIDGDRAPARFDSGVQPAV
jgi:hypothetical protein